MINVISKTRKESNLVLSGLDLYLETSSNSAMTYRIIIYKL